MNIMAERCRETCPLLAMANGQKQLLYFIREGTPRKYLSQLDRLQTIIDDPDYQHDHEFTAKTGDLERQARAAGPGVAHITELAENLMPTVDEIIDAAVELCPGLEIESGSSPTGSVIKCGGFSLRATQGLVESQLTFLKTINKINK